MVYLSGRFLRFSSDRYTLGHYPKPCKYFCAEKPPWGNLVDAAEKKLIKYGRKMEYLSYNLNKLAQARIKDPPAVLAAEKQLKDEKKAAAEGLEKAHLADREEKKRQQEERDGVQADAQQQQEEARAEQDREAEENGSGETMRMAKPMMG